MAERQKIHFTVDEIDEFLWKEVGYKIVQDESTGTDRWHEHFDFTVERLEDGTFWYAGYQTGATEYQDLNRYERWHVDGPEDKVTFQQVFAKPKTIIVYE
jgi:hypothetical protein